ncbi:MAG: choice-of-anchor B family protein [Gemmatimonadetes bacterium]|nr:choice-of-anchor B family protein [Gemmatimonadota bacterium]
MPRSSLPASASRRTRPAGAALFLAALVASSAPATAQEPNFGRATAMTGSTLVIGQPVNWYGPGVVYTYAPDGSGSWMAQSTLAAPDSSRMDDFGRALALEGDRLVVGAPRKRDGTGVVYVFNRSDASAAWILEDVLEPSGSADHREYGSALALSGDRLLVGSPAVEGAGVVYAFQRGSDGWALEHTIRAPRDAAMFGAALSWLGDRVLVGAPASNGQVGGAYVVERSAEGWGTPQAVVLSGDFPERAGIGTSVLLRGNGGVVGAPGAAAAYRIAEGDGGGWMIAEALGPADDPPGSGFGFSLAESDGELWVGAPGVGGGNGRVYRFVADASGAWSAAEGVDPDDTSGASWPLGFGYSMAAADGRAVIGMPTRDFGEGRAMVLSRAADGWQADDVLEGEIFRIGSQLETGQLCEDGAMTEFPCTNMEMVAHIQVDDLGGERGVWVNDVWGWTDPMTERNYALVARRDGASFVDVTDPASPRVLGNLPRTEGSRPSVWRDIKVIDTHAFIVADGAGQHGMQVFDLTRLRDVTGEPVVFDPDYTYTNMASAHNVVADPETGFLYIVGANSGGETCGGGLHIVDANEPLDPTFAGCYHDTGSPGSRGYTHDAQCLVYRGPDEEYAGRRLCIGSNESEINIADVTDPENTATVARMSYPSVAYAHQGWFDEEQRYFYMNDEGDETAGNVERTRTIVWDLTDLDDPVVANMYLGPVPASDHNLYVVGDYMYQSNYGSGLRVIDISDRENPVEIAHFDSAPYNDDGPGFSATQSGAWSNYPFFGNGLVIFTSVREGLFIMRVRPPIS